MAGERREEARAGAWRPRVGARVAVTPRSSVSSGRSSPPAPEGSLAAPLGTRRPGGAPGGGVALGCRRAAERPAVPTPARSGSWGAGRGRRAVCGTSCRMPRLVAGTNRLARHCVLTRRSLAAILRMRKQVQQCIPGRSQCGRGGTSLAGACSLRQGCLRGVGARGLVPKASRAATGAGEHGAFLLHS